MAGVKGMTGSGGPRAGAGRKRLGLSERETNKLVKAARKRARETGKDVWDILLDMVYSNKNRSKDPRAVLAAIKIYSDAVIAKQVHKTIDAEVRSGPVIYLPEKYPAGERRDMSHLKNEEEIRH